MTNSKMKYFSLAITLLAVAMLLFGHYIDDYLLLPFPFIILSLYIMAVSVIVYRLLQLFFFKTIFLRRTYNWFTPIVMFLFAIWQLWYGRADLLFGFPQYIVVSGLFILLGIINIFKFVPKYSHKQGTK